MITTVGLESVSFQCPARVGASTVTGASNSTAGGSPCEIVLDLETRLVCIKHLASKRKTLVPLENVAGMSPLPEPSKK